MSDVPTIIDHGFVPEEHAPEPVTSHGDPTPPGKVGVWLFLASEIMFFVGLLATYIIFRSGSPKIFAEHAAMLNKGLAGVNTLVLIFSSLTMALAVDAVQRGLRGRALGCLALTIACAVTFLGIKYYEYATKLTHHTVVAKGDDGKIYVYDGHRISTQADGFTIRGYRMEMPADGPFDIHWMSETGVEKVADMQSGARPPDDSAEKKPEHPTAAEHGAGREFFLKTSSISQDITYGPWKNVFYACYFTLTGVHGLHVLGGIAALSCLFVHTARGKLLPAHTEYVGLYWHFVDLVWIFLFPLLYLI